jgi:membrane protein DedA with SNARE-associated domain
MTTESVIQYVEWGVAHAPIWGFAFIFLLMAVESSLIPFPSEVIMIPGGFLAYRAELSFGNPHIDMIAVLFCGLGGSMVGAFFNYYLALFLGRPFLYRYGKYFFVKPKILSRAEEIFLEYGEITTFVCRFIPAIRQLISLPAGICRMALGRFALFTGLGAGIWSAILVGIGCYLGSISEEMTYAQLVYRGKEIIKENAVWLVLCLVVLVIGYGLSHHLVMKPKTVNRKP